MDNVHSQEGVQKDLDEAQDEEGAREDAPGSSYDSKERDQGVAYTILEIVVDIGREWRAHAIAQW